jgi:hypothetical protein
MNPVLSFRERNINHGIYMIIRYANTNNNHLNTYDLAIACNTKDLYHKYKSYSHITTGVADGSTIYTSKLDNTQYDHRVYYTNTIVIDGQTYNVYNIKDETIILCRSGINIDLNISYKYATTLKNRIEDLFSIKACRIMAVKYSYFTISPTLVNMSYMTNAAYNRRMIAYSRTNWFVKSATKIQRAWRLYCVKKVKVIKIQRFFRQHYYKPNNAGMLKCKEHFNLLQKSVV